MWVFILENGYIQYLLWAMLDCKTNPNKEESTQPPLEGGREIKGEMDTHIYH